jgi:hypothetical protein
VHADAKSVAAQLFPCCGSAMIASFVKLITTLRFAFSAISLGSTLGAGVCSIFGLQIEHLLRRVVGNSLNSGCVSALAAPGLCLFNADYPAGAELHDPRCQIGLLELVEIGNTDADGLTEFVDRISE